MIMLIPLSGSFIGVIPALAKLLSISATSSNHLASSSGVSGSSLHALKIKLKPTTLPTINHFTIFFIRYLYFLIYTFSSFGRNRLQIPTAQHQKLRSHQGEFGRGNLEAHKLTRKGCKKWLNLLCPALGLPAATHELHHST